MALLPNDTPKRTRLKWLDIILRGAEGAGNAPSKGSGGDEGLIIRVPSTQSVPVVRLRKQGVNAVPTELFDIDQNGNISVMGGIALTTQVAQVALTAANLLAMYAAPVQILPAPGAGLALVVYEILFEMKSTATQFASGGAVQFQFGNTANAGGTAVHAGTIPATVVNAAAGTSLTGLWSASGTNGLTIPSNTGLFISNASGAFTTGTGTAIAYVEYGTLTLG
jgi:hypothetical protein